MTRVTFTCIRPDSEWINGKTQYNVYVKIKVNAQLQFLGKKRILQLVFFSLSPSNQAPYHLKSVVR